MVEVCAGHLHSSVEAPSVRLGSEVPSELERLVLDCLATDPSARPKDALEFIERGQQTLVFANNRLATEVLVTYLKDAFDKVPLPPETVRGYRGGYLPKERRAIEQELRAGEIRAVVATNALELGIDIGSLDAVVMAGYPGTIASTWQRAGRAARRGRRGGAHLHGRADARRRRHGVHAGGRTG